MLVSHYSPGYDPPQRRDVLEAQVNYGPLKRHCEYRVVDEGYDWIKVSVNGSILCAPRWVFD